MEKATKEIRIAKYELKIEEYATQFAAGYILLIVSTMEMYAAANINEVSRGFGGGTDVVATFCLIISIIGIVLSIVLMQRAIKMYQKTVIKLEVTRKTKVKTLKDLKK